MTKIKVLYVEDEMSLAQIVIDTLETWGYDIKHVDRGKSVEETFLAFQPQLFILDVMLPDIDGFQIARTIREVDKTTPILFLTTKSQLEDALEGFESGGNDYIRKPFSLKELNVRMDNLLMLSYQGPSLKEQGTFKIGGLTFNYKQQELTGEEGTKTLSYRESLLLRQLCRSKGKVVKRQDILLEIWGDDSFFNSRNLDVYITKLRSYLKKDPSVQILTLKGVGYRLLD